MFLYDFNDFDSESVKPVMAMLKARTVLAMRDCKCAKGHEWPAVVQLDPNTTRLSGEETMRCPVCDERAMFMSPWSIVSSVELAPAPPHQQPDPGQVHQMFRNAGTAAPYPIE